MSDVPLLPRPTDGRFVANRPLLFALNGHRVEIPSPDPSITLLSFLRSHTQFTGTKLSCGEGGCGACLVLLSTYDPKSKRVREFSINSCLALLCSLDGCSITTIEGIGSTRTGFHAVQQRIAGFHGSHCGFCTPGMCISIYSCLRNAHESPSDFTSGTHVCAANSVPHVDNGMAQHRHQNPVHTIPTLACEDAQKAMVGNICRCTGYRPIVDTCKSFAGDVDIEDLGINTFWASNKDASVNLLPAYVRGTDPTFPKFLIEELDLKENLASIQLDPNHAMNNHQTSTLAVPLHVKLKDASVVEEERLWIQARSLGEVFQALQCHHGRGDVKLVVGNTSAGYYKGQNPRVFIDISHVPELLMLHEVSGTLNVGSAITIEELILALESVMRSNRCSNESVIRGFVSHLKKLANPHVRHRASVGGNLIMAQQFSFDSDLATLLLAVGASLHLVDVGMNRTTLSLEEFLQKGSLESGWLLECIHIPLWLKEMVDDAVCYTYDSSREVSLVGSQSHCISNWRFDSYRASPRSLGNSLAYINGAFLAKILNTGSCYRIMDVRLAFGAFGQGHAIRAHKVEGFLRNRPVHESVLLEATTILKSELTPFVNGTKMADYKSSVAVSFLFDFFSSYLQCKAPSELSLATECGHNGSEPSIRSQNEKVDQSFIGENSMLKNTSFSISGRQSVPVYEDDIALGMAVEKSEVKLQTSGEAIYVDDIPSPEHCLYAAFVPSAKAFARVKTIDTKIAIASPGAVAFISASDIPKGGANVGVIFDCFERENLFAADCVEYVGHPLGVMVADSPEHAKEAAAKVRVEYEVESSPLLCVEEAETQGRFFLKSAFPFKFSVGDIETGFLEADHQIIDGEVRSGSQYFFYMETQTALAVPDEDNCLVVYSSCQSPSVVQNSISACLGLSHHNVRVITRRLGGAFGGKAFRNIVVASACAVAAHKLRHPVRMYLDRKTDMVMMGGRHPVKALYSVSFKHDGKVTGLRAKILIDGGWSQDFTAILHLAIYEGLRKYNWVSLDIEFLPCRTNLPSKSAMRAPGFVQGSFIADTILEHISSVLGLDMKLVVSRNLHTIDSARISHPDINIACKDDFDLLSLWNMMLKRVEAKERDINSFNMSNHWLKRGLSVLPCVYKVHRSPIPARVSIFKDGSVVVEVGGIEMGQGLWTKVKQATMNGLSPLCASSKECLESLKIRVVQADSMSLPHGGLTSSSTTSEGSCEAVMKACQLLVERLMPVKLQKEKDVAGKLSWVDLISLSNSSKVNLSAQVHWFPDRGAFAYLTYSVAATEVEINTLTGAVTIVESDLIYDCGKSLNPAVDIGQIEGSFVQGIGFFLTEQHEVDENGMLLTDGTWTYKPPTVDNIPRKFHVEMISGAARQNRVLSAKACGEPPLLLAGTVHSAVRQAIKAARKGYDTFAEQDQGKDEFFRLDAPASMERVKKLCGLERVEDYLKHHTDLQSCSL